MLQGKQQSRAVKDALFSMTKSFIPSGDKRCCAVAAARYRGSVVQLNSGKRILFAVPEPRLFRKVTLGLLSTKMRDGEMGVSPLAVMEKPDYGVMPPV